MRRFFASFYRIASRAGFLGVALILALVFWHLPHLLNLDALRPRVADELETTFHAKVLFGGLTGQLFPSPGLLIGRVVLLDNVRTPRVLASASAVRMSLSVKTLLKGKLAFKTILFLRPRLIAHRIREPSGSPRWVLLNLPNAASPQENAGVDEWQLRDGRIEIWDHTRTPTTKWVADHLSGTFLVRPQTGALGGTTRVFGHRAFVDVRYIGADPFPLQAHLKGFEISALQFLLPVRLLKLAGQADLSFQARFQPVKQIRAQLDQPSGAGHVEATIQPTARGDWEASVVGKGAHVPETVFDVPVWSAKKVGPGITVKVHGTSAEGGRVDVVWEKPTASEAATLDVDLRSVTLRQILQVFKVESKAPAVTGAAFNPYGYEPWRISQGSVSAQIHGTRSFKIQGSTVDIAGMHLEMTGAFDLLTSTPQATLQGTCRAIPMTSVVESFFPGAHPLTGTGTATFSLSFPVSGGWLKGLNGPVSVQVKRGVLRDFKTLYRIMAVLNLGNYLRLRMPKITAKGVEFEDLFGHLTFQNGVLSTDDLFLRSSNMNMGAKGSLDIPGQRVKVTLRLEMLRFLEDVLKNVPLTHWIFKKPNKIFLPLAVSVEGPWNDVNIH